MNSLSGSRPIVTSMSLLVMHGQPNDFESRHVSSQKVPSSEQFSSPSLPSSHYPDRTLHSPSRGGHLQTRVPNSELCRPAAGPRTPWAIDFDQCRVAATKFIRDRGRRSRGEARRPRLFENTSRSESSLLTARQGTGISYEALHAPT